MVIENDLLYMRMALREARKGLGKTSPNPCVGAVIVKNDQVIAKGYHRRAGTPHAEIHALRRAGEQARGGTLYVTLEPCNHTGRTPPCSHAIAAAGISRVVAGMEDPNPLVNGSGLSYLQQHGIATTAGVLAEECRRLNEPFIKLITTGLPWLVMKAGVSLDGKLNYQRGKSGWITGESSVLRVHRLRSLYDAILIGGRTLEIDNPSLTTRLPGNKGRDPLRVVLDSELSAPSTCRVYNLDSTAATWVFCSVAADQAKKDVLTALGVKVCPVARKKGGLDLGAVLQILGKAGISSVMVEGGGQIHGSFLRERLYDFAHLFVGPVFAGDGGVSLLQGYQAGGKDAATALKSVTCEKMGEDFLISGWMHYPQERCSP